MTFQETKPAFRSQKDDVPFGIEELFFSRTDERGVIASGNSVFQRVSQYSWDELKGAPHKIIRHPDMPKGVFHILWDRIQRGHPTGAYVKNRAKDGRHYWVYAVASPIDGGYVSVRIKPTSELFQEIPNLYAAVLDKEKEGLTPEQSAAHIRATLGDLGFPSYAAFSAVAFSGEIKARDAALGRRQDGRMGALLDILPILTGLREEQEALFQSFAGIRSIPSNMRIVASRLEPAGGPISAISQNYRLMSDEVTGNLGGLRANSGHGNLSPGVDSRIYNSLFVMGASRLQREVLSVTQAEISKQAMPKAFEADSEILAALLSLYKDETSKSLIAVNNDIQSLTRSSRELRQLVTGLDSIRVLCRVEAGRLGANSVSLVPVIDQLDTFHKRIDKMLEQIVDHAESVNALVESAMPRKPSRFASPRKPTAAQVTTGF